MERSRVPSPRICKLLFTLCQISLPTYKMRANRMRTYHPNIKFPRASLRMGKKASPLNERGLRQQPVRGLMDLFVEIRENDCHLRAKVLG
jgi:hypothetical protein